MRGLSPRALHSYFTMDFQLLMMWSAVRQAMACNVSVGLRAPLVPITEPPAIAPFPFT